MPYRRLATPDTRIEDEEAREIEAFAAARRRSKRRVFALTLLSGAAVACVVCTAMRAILLVPAAAATRCYPASGVRADARATAVPVLRACFAS
jgi:hypothetical protein